MPFASPSFHCSAPCSTCAISFLLRTANATQTFPSGLWRGARFITAATVGATADGLHFGHPVTLLPLKIVQLRAAHADVVQNLFFPETTIHTPTPCLSSPTNLDKVSHQVISFPLSRYRQTLQREIGLLAALLFILFLVPTVARRKLANETAAAASVTTSDFRSVCIMRLRQKEIGSAVRFAQETLQDL